MEGYSKILILIFLVFIGCDKASNVDPNNGNDPTGTAPSISWQKSFGGSSFDYASAGIYSSDGGIIIAGTTESTDGDVVGNSNTTSQLWVIKLLDKKIAWQRIIDNGFLLPGIIKGIKIIKDANNNLFILANNTASFSGPVIIKMNEQGSIIWTKEIQPDNWFTSIGYAQDICLNQDNTISITGTLETNTDSLNAECWLARIDANGEKLWEKSFGGSKSDYGYSVAKTPDNGVIIAGSSFSNDRDVPGNHGGKDYFIFKVNEAGQLIWAKNYGGSDTEEAFEIMEIGDGNYYVSGSSYSSDGDITIPNKGSYDYWILKIGGINGTIEWQKSFGGSYGDEPSGMSMIKNSKDFAIVGQTNSEDGDIKGYHGGYDIWVMRLNDSGKLIWQKPLGGNYGEGAFEILGAPQSGLIVIGYTDSSNSGDVTGERLFPDYWVVNLE